MTIQYHPKLGEILLCKFPDADTSLHDDAVHGEMVKDRLVVVVNRKLPGRGALVNVVPISMSMPGTLYPWHVEVPPACLPPSAVKARSGARFAKCDMVCTVALSRLDYYQGHWNAKRDRLAKKRIREAGRLDMTTLTFVKLALASTLEIHGGLFTDRCENAGLTDTDAHADLTSSAAHH